MKHGSLFSGIGGIDLGLERAGFETVWQVEIEPWCRKLLAEHWPDVERFEDVKDVGRANLAPVDLISGGFPCQPVSLAGQREGTQDVRWLWPEMARILGELRPRFVLVENVPGILSVNDGDAMAEVLGDLARLGYDAEWESIPAAAFGAPHLRYRIFIVAYSDRKHGDSGRRGAGALFGQGQSEAKLREGQQDVADPNRGGRGEEQRELSGRTQSDSPGGSKEMADAEGGQDHERESRDLGQAASRGQGVHSTTRDGSPDIPDANRGRRERRPRSFRPGWGPQLADGDWWAAEPDVGRVAHGIPSRVDRLRGLGNAVVPQVSQWIGERIMEEWQRQSKKLGDENATTCEESEATPSNEKP